MKPLLDTPHWGHLISDSGTFMNNLHSNGMLTSIPATRGGDDGFQDFMGYLGDDGVADPPEPILSVHPIGNPISHSENSGVNSLPYLFRNQRSRETLLFVPKFRAAALSVLVHFLSI